MRSALLSAPEGSRLNPLRRSSSLFSQGQFADSLYFIEEGLVKLTRTNQGGSRVILFMCGPGQLVGEEVLSEESKDYYAEAEILSLSTVYRIPREAVQRLAASNPELSSALLTYLLDRKMALAKKVELLCLHDVEYRILYYLAELSTLVVPLQASEGYQLPITQLELADLIGATRETTSTTLNQLERRGLVKLSRRMLTVSSPLILRSEANAKAAHNNGGSAT